MIAKLGSQLWIERKKMAFSLWQNERHNKGGTSKTTTTKHE